MAVSRVPGSRKLFDYAGLQARRKRCSRNPQLEVLDDRVPPYPLSFSATPMLLAIVPTAMLAKPQAAVQRSAHATARSIATTAIASGPVAAHRNVYRSAGQQSPALVQAAAPHYQRLAAAHQTSQATHQALTPTGHRTQANAQPSARSGGAAVSASKGGAASRGGMGSQPLVTSPATSTVPSPSPPPATPPAATGSPGTGAPTAPPASPPVSTPSSNPAPPPTIITPMGKAGTLPSGNDATLNFIPPQPSTQGPAQHVLLLSVDGLHQADVTDPNLAPDLTNILKLQQGGVSYTNASTTSPSDSFPGTLSYLTGAGPGTTGVFYDDSYSRTLFAPGTTNPATTTAGTEVQYAENIDRNQTLISGGGNFDASSIDPTKLPVTANVTVLYPNQFLQVNTIFDVAHQAGLYTAFSDKHPAYQIANGNDPNAINDFYGPEINSTTALLDPTTNKTVDANALLAANPFTDVSKYILVDPSTDPQGPNDPNLINDTTHNVLLTERYDDLKVQAILNEIAGKVARLPGHHFAPVPNLFGMNFQAVSVAQKYALGGIAVLANGDTAPSQVLEAAIKHTDASIGEIVAALQNTRTPWRRQPLELDRPDRDRQARARPARGCRRPDGRQHPAQPPQLAGAPVAQATQDDVSLLYLQDPNQTQTAVAALQNFQRPAPSTSTSQAACHPRGQPGDRQDPVRAVPDRRRVRRPLQGRHHAGHHRDAQAGVHLGRQPEQLQFKRAEHGGFFEDDTHVPLIVSGGALSQSVRGTTGHPVQTKQIAVTAHEHARPQRADLQGVVLEGTKGLPGLHVPQDTVYVHRGPERPGHGRGVLRPEHDRRPEQVQGHCPVGR